LFGLVGFYVIVKMPKMEMNFVFKYILILKFAVTIINQYRKQGKKQNKKIS
jgi:hypothetical protein